LTTYFKGLELLFYEFYLPINPCLSLLLAGIICKAIIYFWPKVCFYLYFRW